MERTGHHGDASDGDEEVEEQRAGGSEATDFRPSKGEQPGASDSEDEEEKRATKNSDDEVAILVTKPEDDEDDVDVYEMSRTPSPLDMMDDTPMMRKKSAQPPPVSDQRDERSPSPERQRSPSPKRRSPSPKRRSPSPKRRSPSPKRRSPSPPKERSPSPLARSPTPDRKDSRGSHGSSSYDDERASSLSPEPTKSIQSPSVKLTGPPAQPPSSQSRSALTKIYTEALGDSDSEERKVEKVVRSRPAGDITQQYTQKLVEREELASPKMDRKEMFQRPEGMTNITQLYTAAVVTGSPKTERKAEMMFQRPEGMKNITQLYTAGLKEEKADEVGSKVKPMRNGNITKLYTGGIGKEADGAFKGKPKDERTNPTKHNLATAVDKAAIMDAYNEVMADRNSVDWAAFTFKDNTLGVTAKGVDFADFKSHFGPDDRGFGYIKIMTGDEMSKRSKFVFCTWVGPNVSVMKKAKMSTDKALLKDIIQNLSVELQVETAGEFTIEHFKAEVDKAGGARYGTGVRD